MGKLDLLKALILLSAVAFFVLFLWDIDYAKLQDVSVDLRFLALSGACALGFRFLGIWIWANILRDLGARTLPDFRELALVYSKSWMARYVPGTVTWVAGRVLFANGLGISKSRLTASTFAELLAQVAAISAVSLSLLALDHRLQEITPLYIKLLVGAAVIGLLVLLIPTVFNFVARSAYRLVRRREAYDELSVNGKVVTRALITYSAGALVSGSVCFFLAAALTDTVNSKDFFFIVGAANLAGIVGILTPLVPSGLGTRDATLLVLLSVILPKEIALIVTVAGRLWSAIADIVFFLITWVSARTMPVAISEESHPS